jgi:lipoic acid synthetase
MILGDICTRDCRFCNVASGSPLPPDPDEPARLAEAVQQLGLNYVVVTSVTRDDLADGGASHFAATIHAIRQRRPAARIEVLVPDFGGSTQALARVLEAEPDVLNHNLETVPRLYPRVRPRAIYRRSLALLAKVRQLAPAIPTKSGLMLGLGERPAEVRATLADLRAVECHILTLGQYLQPTLRHLPVARYVTPAEFEALRDEALSLGFLEVASAPLVRSSYRADEAFRSSVSGKKAPGG